MSFKFIRKERPLNHASSLNLPAFEDDSSTILDTIEDENVGNDAYDFDKYDMLNGIISTFGEEDQRIIRTGIDNTGHILAEEMGVSFQLIYQKRSKLYAKIRLRLGAMCDSI